jgi:hypothetical protein
MKIYPTEVAPKPGDKGDPVTLGVIALALVTGGSIKALIECLKACVSREPSLTIKVKRADGTQVDVSARNVDTLEVRATLETVASGLSG